MPKHDAPAAADPEDDLPRRRLRGCATASAILLAAARELIATRRGWTHGAFARDRHSRPVSLTSPAATRWCLAGAILRAALDAGLEPQTRSEPAGGEATPQLNGLPFALTVAAGLHLPQLAALPLLAPTEPIDEPAPATLWRLAIALLHANADCPVAPGEPSLLVALTVLLNDGPPARYADVIGALDRAIAAADWMRTTGAASSADHSTTGGEA